MNKATFKCECGNIKVVDFELGKKPEAPICEKCGKLMKRLFKNVGVGNIVPEDILYISRGMSYQK